MPSKKPVAPTGRITNETVAEHRERVISGGRRFKYPLQYARHKIVINTTIISIVALVLLGVFGWWQLYVAQNTSLFFYRVTQIVPLPIGNIDGSAISFSDYMLNYRASEYHLAKYDDLSITSQGGKLQLEYKKRDAFNIAAADAYARKIAKAQNLTVTKEEVDTAMNDLRNASNGSLSEKTFEASTEQFLGMSASDLRTSIYNSLLRAKAAFAIDSNAENISKKAKTLLAKSSDFKIVAAELNKAGTKNVIAGSSGAVSTTSTFGGLRASELEGNEIGKVVGPLKSTTDDGYYFIKLTSKGSGQIGFEYLQVPLMAFESQIKDLRAQGKVKEYIKITVSDSDKVINP